MLNLNPKNSALISIALGSAFAIAQTACLPSKTDNSQIKDFSREQLSGRKADSKGNSIPAKTLALTFDDGLSTRSLELAQYLHNEGIQSAFFLNGVNGRTADMAAIQKLNHLIANHTHNHQDMQKSKTNTKSQVVLTDNVIKPYVTGNIFMFRAPFGSWNGSVADFLNGQGLKKYVGSVFWDIGGQTTSRYSADWDCWGKKRTVKACADGYLNEIKDKGRGIVLLHDIHSKTVDMVKYIVPILKKDGYKFIRVDSVPSVAEQIRKAGGTPGALFTKPAAPKPPVVPGIVSCTVASGGDSGMNVRSGEGTTFPILALALNGTVVTKISESGSWARVQVIVGGQEYGFGTGANPVAFISTTGLTCP